MSELVRAPVATVDWLPPRVILRRRVIDAAVRVFERAGFGEVVTPTFEDTALFKRTSGDALRCCQQGDVLLSRPRRPRADPAPRGDGARRTGLPRARPGTRATAREALVRRAHVPLRPRPARPLPRALAVRRGVPGIRRPRGRRRGDRAPGRLVRRARPARRARAAAELDRRPHLPPGIAACSWPISSVSAASSPRTRWRASRSTRCASSIPRTRAIRGS